MSSVSVDSVDSATAETTGLELVPGKNDTEAFIEGIDQLENEIGTGVSNFLFSAFGKKGKKKNATGTVASLHSKKKKRGLEKDDDAGMTEEDEATISSEPPVKSTRV